MKVLFLAPRFPLPADTGGKIRTLNILKQLAKRVKIHLVCFSFDQEDKDRFPYLEKEGVEVTLVSHQEPGLVKKIKDVLSHPLPVSIAKYYSEDMETILKELNETNRFDAVHIDHVHMAHYLDCFSGVPCVIDEHNVEYKILERCADVERSWIKRALFKSQAKKMREFERERIRSAKAYLAVSEDDKKLLQDLAPGASGYVVPNGVDTAYFKKIEDRKEKIEDAIVFTGSMDWLPNNDAALYFCKDILPLIWQTEPGVKFYIVGKGASAGLTEYAKRDRRIVLTGRVDDVRVFVERSKVFAVPLRIGGGTRLKILEALSMEKAVVSTTIGAEGISHQNGHNIVLADEPGAFAENVVQLLKDPQRCASLGKAGRDLVIEKYEWNVIGSKLKDIYETIKV